MANPPAAPVRRQASALLLALAMLGGAAAHAAPPITRAEIPAPAVGENHGAAVAELPSGALLVCWYSGDHEEDVSVRILCSRGTSDGASWSPPWTAVAP